MALRRSDTEIPRANKPKECRSDDFLGSLLKINMEETAKARIQLLCLHINDFGELKRKIEKLAITHRQRLFESLVTV